VGSWKVRQHHFYPISRCSDALHKSFKHTEQTLALVKIFPKFSLKLKNEKAVRDAGEHGTEQLKPFGVRMVIQETQDA
jgi:hypothetical protein